MVGNVAVDPEGHGDLYVYHVHAQVSGDRNWGLTQVVRTRGSITALVPAIRGLLDRSDPQLVMYQPMTLADAIGQGEAQRTFTLRLLGTYALVALGLAALGLFGVLSYGVRMRTREFGIRLALGADGRRIRGMVLREGLVVTGLGIVAGAMGALALSRVMGSVLFKVATFDPSVFALAVAFTLAVALVSAYLPARRATRMDPMWTLREE